MSIHSDDTVNVNELQNDDVEFEKAFFSSEKRKRYHQHARTRRQIELMEERRRIKEELGDYEGKIQWNDL